MNRVLDHLNILLICMNVMGLGTYLYSRIILSQQFEYLLIIFIISITSIQKYVKHIKCHFCIVATFATIAAFIKHQKIDLIILAIAFSVAVNLGYAVINRCKDEMRAKIYELGLNLAFTVGVIASLFCNYMGISRVAVKIVLLATTLPNFYLSMPQNQRSDDYYGENEDAEDLLDGRQEQALKIGNKLIYYLNPLFCETWVYALGYSIGIYLNIFEVFSVIFSIKNIKYLIIALFLLIETLTYRQFIKSFCIFMRSLLVFHFQRSNHNYECYFILGYIILKNLIHADAINIYLMVGYLLIAVTLWREEYILGEEERRQTRKGLTNQEPFLEQAERDSMRLDREVEIQRYYEIYQEPSEKKIWNQSRRNLIS